jgi:hypothetical protein
MRITFSICVLILLNPCFNADSSSAESNQQNQRITRLEERIDSLIGTTRPQTTLSSDKRSDKLGSQGRLCKSTGVRQSLKKERNAKE